MASSELMEVLGNKYSLEILNATDTPRSATELSDELGVPIATCYRRVEELADKDLLELEDYELSEGNRRRKVYRRTISDIHISFDESVSVETQDRRDLPNRLDSAWQKLTKGLSEKRKP